MWYERYPVMAGREQARIKDAFSGLALDTATGGDAIVTGVTEVIPDVGFSTHLIVPANYPNGVPVLRCDPKEIPWIVDRHVYGNGVACLCVASEYRTHWPRGSDIADFLSKLVVPYFVAQLYFEAHGHWPATGQRSHGREGVIEAYRDFLAPLGSVSERSIHDTMKLMARVSPPKGHHPCPCGSGRKLRKCHRELFWKLRSRIDCRHAASDYALVYSRQSPVVSNGGTAHPADYASNLRDCTVSIRS